MCRQLIGSLALAVAACGESGPSEYDAYVGTWTVEVEAKSGCWPAFEFAFEITQEDVDNGRGLEGDCWFVSNPSDRRYYEGSITDWGNFHFGFFQEEYLPDYGAVLSFDGSDASPGGLHGTLLNLGGLFPPDCWSAAHATKRGGS